MCTECSSRSTMPLFLGCWLLFDAIEVNERNENFDEFCTAYAANEK